ncbi:MAG: helix-turn-helix transcriptional regulator [Candidatus Aenigmarchaeota archaeon]|nr:helix-turn-helix transcriptional regulator [Candidatus Aenigmarchaeota archaeon]
MRPLKRLEQLNTSDNLWVYILKILEKSPTHAYAIRNEIEELFGFRPGTMTAYKVLYLLRKEGLVSKTRDGRKRVYAITDRGRRELKAALKFYSGILKMLEK